MAAMTAAKWVVFWLVLTCGPDFFGLPMEGAVRKVSPIDVSNMLIWLAIPVFVVTIAIELWVLWRRRQPATASATPSPIS
jgi:hypothetical protein